MEEKRNVGGSKEDDGPIAGARWTLFFIKKGVDGERCKKPSRRRRRPSSAAHNAGRRYKAPQSVLCAAAWRSAAASDVIMKESWPPLYPSLRPFAVGVCL